MIQHRDTTASAICDWLNISHKYARNLPRVKRRTQEGDFEDEHRSQRARIEEVQEDVDIVVDEVDDTV